MKHVLTFALLAFSLNASELAYSDDEAQKRAHKLYTVQLYSSKQLEPAKRYLEKLPSAVKEKTELFRVGEYIAARYEVKESIAALQPLLEELKSEGIKGAHLVETTQWHRETNRIALKSNEAPQSAEDTQQPPQSRQESRENPTEPKRSKFLNAQIIAKAQKAYEEGRESEALIYYEMLYASGEKSSKLKTNLCYLYGKKGAWFEAKKIIERERYAAHAIYAYAYGAAEVMDANLYNDIAEYLMFDKSGRLLLLMGSYFEKTEAYEKAAEFYKMAKEKNPSDPYNLYAYARSLDILQDPQSLILYKELMRRIAVSHALYGITQRRVAELGG